MRTDLERIGWRMVVRNLQNWHPTQLAFILAQSAERTKVHKKKIKFRWNSVTHLESAAYGACHLKMCRFKFPVKRIDFFKK